MVKTDYSGLSEVLFALRMYPSKNGKSPYEKRTGKEPNTMKKLVINRGQFISEPADFKLTETHFEFGQDSTVLVRELTRGSKLEGAYQKKTDEMKTNHAVPKRNL